MVSHWNTWKILLLVSGLTNYGDAQNEPSASPTISLHPTIFQARISDPLLIVAFDDNNTESEITLKYNISDLDYEARLLPPDCNQAGSVADTSIVMSYMTMINGTAQNDTDFSGDMRELDVILDLKPDGLENDPTLFNGTDPEATTVDFCVRVDLIMAKEKFLDVLTEDEYVTFHQTKVTVIVNTTVGFEVSNINLMTEYDEVNKNVDFTYKVDAYQCDRTGEQASPVIKQSESVFICAETTSEVSIMDIKTLVFRKDASTTLTAIRDRASNAVTSKRPLNDKKWIVQSRLVSRFYSMDGIVTVSATGAVIMGFGGASGRRLQQATGVESDESGFNAEFSIAPLEEVYAFDDVSSSIKSGGLLCGFTTALILLSNLL